MAYSVRVGAYGAGTTSFTAAVPTGSDAPVAGDAMYIFMESSDSSTAAGTPTTPTGWSKLYEETQGAGAAGVTTLTIFGKLAGVGETDVTVSGIGNHGSGCLVVVGGHTISAISQTIIGLGNGGNAARQLPGSINAVAVAANSIVFAAATFTRDYISNYNFVNWSNGTLTDFTLLEDNTVAQGTGGGVAVLFGFSASATSSGTTSFNTTDDGQWRAVHIALPATAPATTYSQPHFRVRDDSTALNTDGGWLAALDTNVAVTAEQKFRIRFELEGGAAGASQTFKLQARRNNAYWFDVPLLTWTTDEAKPTSTHTVDIMPSAQYLNDDATTNLLAGSAATFQAGVGLEDNSPAAITLTSKHTEYEWCLRVPIGYGNTTISRGRNDKNDTFQFRIVQTNNTPLGTYSALPALTLNVPDGLIGGTYVESPCETVYGDTNGNIYLIQEFAECAPWPLLVKSSDGGKSWYRQLGGLGEPINPNSRDLEGAHIDVVDGIMHIALTAGTNNSYHRFHTSAAANPDTWQAKDEIFDSPATAPADQKTSIAGRSDGSAVVAYRYGFNATYDRIGYRTRTPGGVWSALADVDDTATTHFTDVWCVRTVADLIYIFYFDYTNGVLYFKTLAMDGTLSARTAVQSTGFTLNSSHEKPMAGVVYYDDGGTEKVMVVYIKSDGKLYHNLITSGTPGTETNVSATVVRNHAAGASSQQPFAHIRSDGTTIYCLYVDDATNDIWETKSNNGAAWSTPAEVVDAVSADFLRGAIFTHSVANGGKLAYGFTYDEALGYTGKIRYFEFIPPSGLVTSTRTHTTDAIVKKTLTRTHTTDADVFKTITKTHSVDAVISIPAGQKTHTVSAVIRKVFLPTHTVDALLRRTFTLIHTADAVVSAISGNFRSHTVSAIIKKTLTLTHSVSAVILKSSTKTHTTDAIIGATTGGTRTHTVTAVIKKVGNLRSHTTGAYIVPLAQPISFTATVISPTQVDLSWSAVTGALGYDIERNGTIIVFRHGSTTYSDTSVVSGVTYTYRVRAVK